MYRYIPTSKSCTLAIRLLIFFMAPCRDLHPAYAWPLMSDDEAMLDDFRRPEIDGDEPEFQDWPDQWPNRKMGDAFVEHSGMMMPSDFKRALTMKWRGQAFGASRAWFLNHFFSDAPRLKQKTAFEDAPTGAESNTFMKQSV